MVSYYVCRICTYTMYLSYTYVLCYNIQEYGICSFCNRYIKLKTKRQTKTKK